MTEVIEKTENKKGYKKTKLGWIPEEWDVVKISDVLKIKHGKDQKQVQCENGKYPILGTGGIIGKTNSFIYNKESVLIGRKGTINKPFYMDSPFWTIDTLFYSEIHSNNIPKYIYYVFCNIKWLRYDESTGMPSLNSNTIENIKIILPKIKEQEKIAEILSAWDDGIETLEKLIEQKEVFHKALMKNLLVGKKRLAGFSKNSEYKRTRLGQIPADWQIKPLKLLFDKRMQKYSGNTEHNIFTNSATKGVVLQNEYFDRSIVTEENTSNYYVVGENDFMYNPRISQSAPAGPINRNKLGITGIASPLYTIFKAKHDTMVDFYEQYFSSNLWNNSMFMVANQGARHDRLNITSNDFMNMPLPYPPIKEQEKIATVLIESYKEIQILNSKLEKLKMQKKGLMQKLLTGQIRVKV